MPIGRLPTITPESVHDRSVLFCFVFCRLPCLLGILTSICKATTNNQPHIIFILADDLVSNLTIKLWISMLTDSRVPPSPQTHACINSATYPLLTISLFTGMGWRWLPWFQTDSNSKYRRDGQWGRHIKQLLCVPYVHSDKSIDHVG